MFLYSLKIKVKQFSCSFKSLINKNKQDWKLKLINVYYFLPLLNREIHVTPLNSLMFEFIKYNQMWHEGFTRNHIKSSS